MPTAVELSTWIAVGPSFHQISVRVVRIGTSVWVLTKMVPYLASTADGMLLRMILHTTSKMPLTVGTKSSRLLGLVGPLLRKLTPLDRLLAWDNESYETSECMANCIPLALCWIPASNLSVYQARCRSSGVHFLRNGPPDPNNLEYFYQPLTASY